MKKLFSLSLLLSFVTIVMAEGITKEQALDRARQFMAKRNASFSQARSANGNAVSYSVSSLYDGKIYAVNAEGNGFVLVSGDDATDLILGYADNGTFTLDNAPDNVRYWMECYAEQMDAIAQGKGKVRSSLASTIKTPVQPMIQTKWGQGVPYNDQCVMTWDEVGSAPCMTGCAATAMAQVMNFYQHPTTEIAAMGSYKPWSNTTMSALPATTIDWSKMCDIYTSSATTEQKAEVAKLMRYCGQALNMQYGQNLSNASSSATYPALTDKFGYDKSLQLVYRHDYTIAEWDAIIYKEMKEGRPVIYNGQSTGGGHAFVVDGYDGDEHFHVNWGWDGMHDGYFLLSLMNALSNTGAGASSTPDGYTMQQMAFINIKPSVASSSNLIIGVSHLKLEGDKLSMRYFKESGDASNDILGIAVINSSDQVTYCNEMTSPGYETGTYDDLEGVNAINYQSCLTSMPDGDYRITGAYKIGDVWHTCLGGDVNYLSVTKTGSSYTNVVCHPVTNVSVVSAELTGSREAGEVQEVRVTFQNTGSDDYQETVQMKVGGTIHSKACVVIPAGKTTVAYFYFTPSAAGDVTLQFQSELTHAVLGTPSVTIGASTHSGLYVSAMNVANVCPGDDSKLYLQGNSLLLSMTLTNADDETHNYATGYVSFEVQHVGSGEFYSGSISPFSLNAHNSLPVNINPMNVTGWGEIKVTIYRHDTDPATVLKQFTLYYMGNRVIARDVNSVATAIAPDATLPATVTSVDATHLGTSPSLNFNTSSANPNCLYYLAEGATAPACLSGKNVIIGNTADQISLVSGNDFSAPINFRATSATYTTQYANGTDGTGTGWNTLCIPFSATNVTEGANTLHWFNSTNSNGDFWLYEFASDTPSSVSFSHVEGSMVKANTPYIIAVPNDKWGSQYDLTGKNIVFSGSDVDVISNAGTALTASNYKFVGSYAVRQVDAYVLNNEGSTFKHSTTAVTPQFGAYFQSVNNSFSSALNIIIEGQQSTSIGSISAPVLNTEKVFNVMGQQVSPDAKGIKIIKGRKFIK